jgi:DNA-binding transcriptional MocR family regulator
VYGTSQYYLKSVPQVGLLLGYARLTETEIREGIKKLGQIFAD